MGKSSRDKGQRGEREVCKYLSQWLNLDVTRELGASRDGGCDIIVQISNLTYFFEVKLYRKVTQNLVHKWWLQAWEQAQLGEKVQGLLDVIPVLVYRQSHWKEWEVVVPLGWMVHMLECSNKIRCDLSDPEKVEKIGMELSTLTDIMLLGKNHSNNISEGKMDILMDKEK